MHQLIEQVHKEIKGSLNHVNMGYDIIIFLKKTSAVTIVACQFEPQRVSILFFYSGVKHHYPLYIATTYLLYLVFIMLYIYITVHWIYF
jgi:hypothetical protein